MAPVHRLEQLQAVHAAHAQVGDEQLRQFMVQPGEGGFAAVGLDEVVAFVAQAQRQQAQQ